MEGEENGGIVEECEVNEGGEVDRVGRVGLSAVDCSFCKSIGNCILATLIRGPTSQVKSPPQWTTTGKKRAPKIGEERQISTMYLQRLSVTPPRRPAPPHALLYEFGPFTKCSLNPCLILPLPLQRLYLDLPPLVDNPSCDAVIIIYIHWPNSPEPRIFPQKISRKPGSVKIEVR